MSEEQDFFQFWLSSSLSLLLAAQCVVTLKKYRQKKGDPRLPSKFTNQLGHQISQPFLLGLVLFLLILFSPYDLYGAPSRHLKEFKLI
jgi:hypothetical protein